MAKFLAAIVFIGAVPHARSQQDLFAGRPGLTVAEGVPKTEATCETLPGALAGFPTPETRVDLWIKGRLTLVQTDGAVWYLAICSSPAIRVLCVAYNDNGMKAGDVVTLRGGYNRQDPRHVVLDPCLAARS